LKRTAPRLQTYLRGMIPVWRAKREIQLSYLAEGRSKMTGDSTLLYVGELKLF